MISMVNNRPILWKHFAWYKGYNFEEGFFNSQTDGDKDGADKNDGVYVCYSSHGCCW